MAADLVTLPRTPSGYVGCLVVVDHFSKWVAAVPNRKKKSCTIIQALSRQILPFILAIPTNLLTDNGPEFSSLEFTQFLAKLNINHKFTTPHCTTSNGAVERVNRTIQGFLQTVVGIYLGWEVELPTAVSVYNNTHHSEIMMSPSKFLLTKSHKTNQDIPLLSKLSATWKIDHPKFLPFRIGQTVLMKAQHKGFPNINKLSAKFLGLYVVIKVNENGVTNEVKDEVTGDVYRAHHAKLRMHKKPPHYIVCNYYYSEIFGTQDLWEESVSEDNFHCTSDISSSVTGSPPLYI